MRYAGGAPNDPPRIVLDLKFEHPDLASGAVPRLAALTSLPLRAAPDPHWLVEAAVREMDGEGEVRILDDAHTDADSRNPHTTCTRACTRTRRCACGRW